MPLKESDLGVRSSSRAAKPSEEVTRIGGVRCTVFVLDAFESMETVTDWEVGNNPSVVS